MTRTIKSVSVSKEENIYTNESKTTVTVFFTTGSEGYRYIVKHADGTQEKSVENLSKSELEAAKQLSFRDGKWHDVRDEKHAQKLQDQINAISAKYTKHTDGDVTAAEENFKPQVNSESELFG